MVRRGSFANAAKADPCTRHQHDSAESDENANDPICFRRRAWGGRRWDLNVTILGNTLSCILAKQERWSSDQSDSSERKYTRDSLTDREGSCSMT